MTDDLTQRLHGLPPEDLMGPPDRAERVFARARRRRRRMLAATTSSVGVVVAAVVALAVTWPVGGGSQRLQEVGPAGPGAAPATPASSSPTGSPATPAPTEGFYADASVDLPRYVLTVKSHQAGFAGWLFFVYQNGSISVLTHYTATSNADGTFSFRTDAGQGPFPYAHQSPGAGQAGSAPISAGNVYSGTFSKSTVTLTECGSYLYWAQSHSGAPAASCTFDYAPATIGYPFAG